MLNVLFLCTGNSCRSIMAEGLLRHYGKGKFVSLSAGSNPTGEVHPVSIQMLHSNGISVEGFFSKSLDEVKDHQIDVVITVCDNAANESCPVFLNQGIKAHWGVIDPAGFEGSDEQILAGFQQVYERLERRVRALCALDVAKGNVGDLQEKINKIGQL